MKPWLIWTFLAVLSWGVWAVISRLIGDALTPAQGQALSTLGLLPIMAALVVTRKAQCGPQRMQGMAIAFVAGILTSLGNIAYYKVLNSGAKAVTVVPLTALYPIVTLLLGLIFLRERLGRIQILGAGLAFVAIYLFNIQGAGQMSASWLGAALLPILFWGVSGFVQKLSTNYISGELSALSFLTAFIPLGALILWQEPLKTIPGPSVWFWSALLGLTLGLGNFAMLQAFAREGKASVIAPIGGLYPIVSIPIAMVAFRESVGWREALGILISCAAVAALACEKSGSLNEKNI